MVNVALGTADVASCATGDLNGDGSITVNEIISAVNFVLSDTQVAVTAECMLPPDVSAPSTPQPCPDGTPVNLYRCTDLARCSTDPTARVLIASGQSGPPAAPSGEVQFTGVAECNPNATHLLEAIVSSEERYQAPVFGGFGPVSTGGQVAFAASPRTVTIDAFSEAGLRLVDAQGLQNFGAVTFATVLSDVKSAVPLESLAGRSVADAANTATATAQNDPNVQATLGMVLKHHVPESESIDPQGDLDHYQFELHDMRRPSSCK